MRAFFAIELPGSCQSQLSHSIEKLQSDLARLYKTKTFRWTASHNLHLTLQFMADVKEEYVALLLEKVKQVLRTEEVFHLQLGSLEWFPSRHHPKVISVRAEPHDSLARIAQSIGRVMKEVGLPVEQRPFRAHVTLARINTVLRDVDAEVLAVPLEIPPVLVKEIVLFQSKTLEEGPVYTKLGVVGLILDAKSG